MLNILYHHRTQGKGVEGVHIREIVTAFTALGNEVLVVSPPGIDPLVEQKLPRQAKSKIQLLWKWVSRYTPQLLFELLEIAYNVVSYVGMRRAIKEQKINAIYERYAFFGFAGASIAKRYDIPFILEVNEISGLKRVRGQTLTKLAQKIEKRIFQDSDAIMVVSNHLKEKIAEMGVGEDKIHVVPNAVDVNKFNPNSVSNTDIIERFEIVNKFILGFVGSLVKWHNFEFLISAFKEIVNKSGNNIILMLVGDGPMRKDIEQLITDNGLVKHIILTGRVTHKDIPKYIKSMDICIIPHSNEFRSPIKMFEYMAMEKPVVAPNIGPIGDIIQDGRNGVIFELGNKESFKKVVFGLIANPGKRTAIGIEAKRTVLRNHLWIKNGAKIMNIIDSLNKVKVPILIYHNIEEADNGSTYTIFTGRFKEHLEWLYQTGYCPITLSEFASWRFNGGRLPKRPVIITFDDGYRSCYDVAFPLLREYGFNASFFISTNRIGKKNYMDWQDIKAMKESGMEFGSHGHSHRPLSMLHPSAVKYELENSKLLIEEYLHSTVEFVSMPGGYFNNSIKEAAKKVGYKGVLTSQFGTNDRTADLYALKRIGVRNYYTPQHLEKLINDRANLNYRIDYLARFILKKSLGERGYGWLKHCFGLV